MRRPVALVLFITLLSVSSVRAEFYRWVDKDGKESFTNEREKIPQEYRSSSTPLKPDENRVSIEGKAVVPEKSSGRPKEHKDKYGHGEEYWHKRAAKLRTQLKDLESEYDVLVKREQEQERKQTTVKSKQTKTTAGSNNKKAQLEKKIAIAKRKLEVDLPEEARRADAYPGWLRE